MLFVKVYDLDMSQRYTEAEKIEKTGAILALIGNQSVRQACEEVKLPHSTFMGWIGENKTLADQYSRARSLYHDQLAQDILDLSNEDIPKNLERGEANAWVQRQRMRIDAIKWTLSKLAPKKYGDRLTVAGDDDNPIVIAAVERKIIDTGVEEIEE